MKTPLFRGICASTATPFDGEGRPALEKLRPHVDWIIAEGADAISPLGSSGEFPALELDDRRRLLEAVIEICDRRVPVMAGTHHYSTRTTIALSEHAEAAGADALLIVPPYYMVPTRGQTMDHFRRIAEAVSLPIVLYHNITLTAIDLTTDDLVTLFNEHAIAGVKMSNSQPDRICELLQATDGALTVYAGIDSVAFEALCHGGHGWISGIPSIVPRKARELYEAIAIRSDLPAARALWRKLAPLMRMQFSTLHSVVDGPQWFSVMKETLNMISPPVGDPEPPVLRLAERYRGPLAAILKDLGYEVKA